MGVIKGVMISLLIKFISATNTSVIFVSVYRSPF